MSEAKVCVRARQPTHISGIFIIWEDTFYQADSYKSFNLRYKYREHSRLLFSQYSGPRFSSSVELRLLIFHFGNGLIQKVEQADGGDNDWDGIVRCDCQSIAAVAWSHRTLYHAKRCENAAKISKTKSSFLWFRQFLASFQLFFGIASMMCEFIASDW